MWDNNFYNNNKNERKTLLCASYWKFNGCKERYGVWKFRFRWEKILCIWSILFTICRHLYCMSTFNQNIISFCECVCVFQKYYKKSFIFRILLGYTVVGTFHTMLVCLTQKNPLTLCANIYKSEWNCCFFIIFCCFAFNF